MASAAPSLLVMEDHQELAFAAITVLHQIFKRPLAYEEVLLVFERLKPQGQNHICLSAKVMGRGRCELDSALRILCSRHKIVLNSGRYKIRSPFDGTQYPFLDCQVRKFLKRKL